MKAKAGAGMKLLPEGKISPGKLAEALDIDQMVLVVLYYQKIRAEVPR